MSDVPARWEHVAHAVLLRDELQYSDSNSRTLIIGNGDVMSLEEGRQRVEETRADGVMIGRGIFGNPWLFSGHVPTREEKLRVLVEHCYAFDELCSHKSFAVMKKHFKAYVRDFDGAGELRTKLMECETAASVRACLTGMF